MTDETDKGGAPRFEVRTTSDSHFGWVRTRMALDRTQMAWVRTGTSLIAFGFTIYQVLERIPGARRPNSARDLALVLIGTGVLAMLAALLDYRSGIDYLWSPEFAPLAGRSDGKRRPSRVLPVTLVVLGAGIFAFVAVAFRAT